MSATAQTGAPSASAPLTRPAGFPAAAGRVLSSALLIFVLMLLVAVVVAGANGVRVRVEQTGSMAPALQPGDLVLVSQTAIDDIRVGDVIGVRSASGPVIVHRVLRIDGAGSALRVTTKGDANPTSETWNLRQGAQVALVRGSLPEVGRIVDALKGPLLALLVMLAALVLAIAQLRRIWGRTA